MRWDGSDYFARYYTIACYNRTRPRAASDLCIRLSNCLSTAGDDKVGGKAKKSKMCIK